MSHKTLVRVAIGMVVVFGFISIIYPRIFAPKPAATVEVAPAVGVAPEAPASAQPTAPISN